MKKDQKKKKDFKKAEEAINSDKVMDSIENIIALLEKQKIVTVEFKELLETGKNPNNLMAWIGTTLIKNNTIDFLIEVLKKEYAPKQGIKEPVDGQQNYPF